MFQEMMDEIALQEREQSRKREELIGAEQKEKTLKVHVVNMA